MEINGLPLHPLVVHTAVVFAPLAGLAALAYLVPSWRDRLRWPLVVLAVVAVLAVVVAYFSGTSFLASKPQLRASPQVQAHQARAVQLLWVAVAFGIVALASGWLHRRAGAVRMVLNLLLGVAAVGLLVWVYFTGEAGARAVWG